MRSETVIERSGDHERFPVIQKMKDSVFDWMRRDRFLCSMISGIRAARDCHRKWGQVTLLDRCVQLPAIGEQHGRALMSYRIEGFVLDSNDPLLMTHTNYWQSIAMVRVLQEYGFAVDVIDFRNSKFVPKDEYAIFVDVRNNMERLASLVGGSCLKVFHIDTANLLVHNVREATRACELLERRGVALPVGRWQLPNCGIDIADYATGNVGEFSKGTFGYSGKVIYPVPAPIAVSYDFPADKNWKKCRKHFMWFSSSGLVHKGLDLVLEAFAGMPDLRLTVCAPLDGEPEFVRAYHRELYRTPNIEARGWVKLGSTEFSEIVASCGTIVSASCSEGLSTSTLECMHAGLVPVVSYETGVPTDGIGFEINPCNIEGIRNYVRAAANLDPEEFARLAHASWSYASNTHTREKFTEAYRSAIGTMLAQHRDARSAEWVRKGSKVRAAAVR